MNAGADAICVRQYPKAAGTAYNRVNGIFPNHIGSHNLIMGFWANSFRIILTISHAHIAKVTMTIIAITVIIAVSPLI